MSDVYTQQVIAAYVRYLDHFGGVAGAKPDGVLSLAQWAFGPGGGGGAFGPGFGVESFPDPGVVRLGVQGSLGQERGFVEVHDDSVSSERLGDVGVQSAGVDSTSGGDGHGVNRDRNRRNRERRRRNKLKAKSANGVPVQAMEDYADAHGVSIAELDADEFVVGSSVGVADVLTKADMKRLARQRAGLYELRNKREELRLKREIMMEEATLEAGANEARVSNWIADVKSGKTKSSGMSRGTASSGRVTKRSAWSAGSWRTREKSDQTGVSSFVTDEEHQKVVAQAEAYRLAAESVEKEVANLRREIAYLTQGDKFRHDDSLDELGMVPSWDYRK